MILHYLGDKTGLLLPKDVRRKTEVMAWLMWQMGGVGPMLGQANHFSNYAPEKIPYAIERYTKEAQRLYAVLNRHLAGREFIAGDYSIADIACYPWMATERDGIDFDAFPNFKRWKETVGDRPAVVKAYVLAKEINPGAVIPDDEARKFLFGQDASVVKIF